MIKFFRTIRRKYISENKISKYIIYAIGEIVLVMIGILLALQVNNWNIEIKRDLKANELSDNLLEQLIGAKYLTENRMVLLENQQKLIQYVTNNSEIQMDSVLSLANSGDMTLDPIGFLFSYIVYFNPRLNIYNTAINEGSLALIESKQIIRNLSTVYTMSENRLSDHVASENTINTKLQEHISDEYQSIFNSGKLMNNKGIWDKATNNKILKKINTDGKLQYLLSAKLHILRYKYGTLRHRIYPKIEESIDYFENLN